MAATVSLAVIGPALFVALSGHYDATAKKWASGMVGTIVGYWLRGK